jgi:hypothetical protein
MRDGKAPVVLNDADFGVAEILKCIKVAEINKNED